MENELKAKGYSIIEKDGIAYLHMTRQLGFEMQTNETLSACIFEKMDKYKSFKIVSH